MLPHNNLAWASNCKESTHIYGRSVNYLDQLAKHSGKGMLRLSQNAAKQNWNTI